MDHYSSPRAMPGNSSLTTLATKPGAEERGIPEFQDRSTDADLNGTGVPTDKQAGITRCDLRPRAANKDRSSSRRR